MLGAVCQYDRKQHLLLEPSLLEWCKAQSSNKNVSNELFVYRQMQVGTFVIGRWVNKSKGLFVDLVNLGYSLGNFTRGVAQEFRRRLLAPITAEQTKKQMTDFSSGYRSAEGKKNAYNHELMARNKMIPKR